MNRRPIPLAALLLALLCIVLAFSARGAELRHGHLVDLPYVVDGDGQTIASRTHAFLAIKLPVVPWYPQIVDYTQQVDYLSTPQFDLPIGAVLARAIHTDRATPDGWLILPISKPCSPGETSTDVGYLTVCPPREEGGSMDACQRSGGPEPLFAGVPDERVPCAISRRRAVRR